MTSYEEVLSLIEHRPSDTATVIAVCNVHSVMTARRDPLIGQALRQATIATPDGVPLVWAIRAMTNPRQTRVYGPDLMKASLHYGVARGWKHYLLGGTPATIERLVAAANRIAPGVSIVGTHAPPFHPLTEEETLDIVERIRRSGADVVWIGIGMPKQELLMYAIHDGLPGVALAGVGAAFDLLSGTVRQAPPWMQRIGLEWLYRLAREPRRLWRRYLWNNPLFVILALRQVFAYRKQRRESLRT
jgi:N-acetylglucosaminyldiphosphoundecaprenol N-acetyl-beta-D-mannosaminyltransferase